MWEPMSEAEASSCPAAYEPTNCSGNQTCTDEPAAAQALGSFFTARRRGRSTASIRPIWLRKASSVARQCGMQDSWLSAVGSSSGIDVLSVHDYYGSAAARRATSGTVWRLRFAEAKAY